MFNGNKWTRISILKDELRKKKEVDITLLIISGNIWFRRWISNVAFGEEE